MKQVYYKGQSYDFSVAEVEGKRKFQLYKDGTHVCSVEQNELDIKSIVTLILDAYYKNSQATVTSQAAQINHFNWRAEGKETYIS